MKIRIKELINDESLNSAQFANEVGIAASSLHHIISGRNNPSLDVIQKILQRYPQVNAEWLINGKGKKYKNLIQGKLFDIPLEEEKRAINSNVETIKEDLSNRSEAIETVTQEDLIETEMLKNNKAIDSIVIFYKDGSFKQYI